MDVVLCYKSPYISIHLDTECASRPLWYQRMVDKEFLEILQFSKSGYLKVTDTSGSCFSELRVSVGVDQIVYCVHRQALFSSLQVTKNA